MALAKTTLSDESSVLLRFGGVEVDAARHRLSVDGREVRVQRLVFNLLLALCESHGRVLSRDELFSTLWPDGAFPADDSLSQLVFKLRGALGPYGGAVVTVRQVGVRLDADVERVVSAAPAGTGPVAAGPEEVAPAPRAADNEPYAEVAPSAPLAHTPAPPRARRLLAAAVAAFALLALAASLIATRLSAPRVVSAGFGLDADDVQVSDARTLETLQRAFAADADGNQAAARVLMETAHGADPRTPVPAMFLTYWYGGLGEVAAAEHWAAERDRRMGPDTETYLALLARFLSMRDAPTLERLKLESLLLETEPGAALIRIARAHHHLQRHELDAALEHLRQVDLRAAGRRRAPIVLGDLASLGDLARVEEALKSGNDVLDAPDAPMSKHACALHTDAIAKPGPRSTVHFSSRTRPSAPISCAVRPCMRPCCRRNWESSTTHACGSNDRYRHCVTNARTCTPGNRPWCSRRCPPSAPPRPGTCSSAWPTTCAATREAICVSISISSCP